MNIRIETFGDTNGIPSHGRVWPVDRVLHLGFSAVRGFVPVVKCFFRHVEDSGA